MVNQDVHNNLSFSEALQRVVDSSQNVMLAHISSLRFEVKEDLGRALSRSSASIRRFDGKDTMMSGPDSDDHAAPMREVEESQQELSQALGDLAGAVRRSVDPARLITERPLPWVVGGLALGFWFGTKR
jgi:hypothetical protein